MINKNAKLNVKRSISFLLVFAMVLGFFPAFGVSAYATSGEDEIIDAVESAAVDTSSDLDGQGAPDSDTELSDDTASPEEQEADDGAVETVEGEGIATPVDTDIAEEDVELSDAVDEVDADYVEGRKEASIFDNDGNLILSVAALNDDVTELTVSKCDAEKEEIALRTIDEDEKDTGDAYTTVLSFAMLFIRSTDAENNPAIFELWSDLLKDVDLKKAKLYGVTEENTAKEIESLAVSSETENAFTFQVDTAKEMFDSYILFIQKPSNENADASADDAISDEADPADAESSDEANNTNADDPAVTEAAEVAETLEGQTGTGIGDDAQTEEIASDEVSDNASDDESEAGLPEETEEVNQSEDNQNTEPEAEENGEADPVGKIDLPTLNLFSIKPNATPKAAPQNPIDVTVTIDIGYTPDENSNDDSLPAYQETATAEETKQTGDVITLGRISRFGYLFDGWTVSEDGGAAQDIGVAESYTIPAGVQTVEINAKTWRVNSYPFAMSVTSNVPLENVEISLDGGNTYQDFVTWANDPQWVDVFYLANTNIVFGNDDAHKIAYGETIGAYLHRMGVTSGDTALPILRDTREDGVALRFAYWTPASMELSAGMRFKLGENGFLTKQGTFAQSEVNMQASATAINAVWTQMSFPLTITNKPSDWSWSYFVKDANNNIIETAITTSPFNVPYNATVELKVPVTANSIFTKWSVAYGTERIFPVEQPYTAGDQYYRYRFTMPAAQTEAVYAINNIYVPLEGSPILFMQNVTAASGRTGVYGFWYCGEIEGFSHLFTSSDLNPSGTSSKSLSGTHAGGAAFTDEEAKFYEWNPSLAFYVTSHNEPTQNKLELISALTVYFKDCNLQVQDVYSNELVGRRRNTTYLAMANNNISDAKYGNIIINHSYVNSYTVKLYSEGENTLGVITKNGTESNTAYNGTLYVYGSNSGTAHIASVLGNISVYFENLTLLPYESEEHPDNFEYLMYVRGSTEGAAPMTFTNCNVQLPEKSLHSTRGPLTFRTNTVAVLKSTLAYSSTSIASNSNIHILGNLVNVYQGIAISGTNTKLLVDGCILRNYNHWNAGSSISGGTVIVKGATAELGCFTQSGGFILANNVTVGRWCKKTGGVMVTNQLTNASVGYVVNGTPIFTLNDDRMTYSSSGYVSKTTTNGDNIPYATYTQVNQTRTTPYSFSGGTLYLLGYYEISGDMLNREMKITDSANPLLPLYNRMVTDDEITATSIPAADLRAAVEESSQTRSSNECVMIGSTAYRGETGAYRFVTVSGSASIYAAGNVTFWNDTTITGGTIVCHGNLGCKNDLVIDGGNITANAIGNVRHLTRTVDGLTHWETTDINGGTLTTDLIGAVLQPELTHEDGAFNRSTVNFSGSPVIQPRNGNEVKIVDDMYINYVYDNDVYRNNTSNPQTIRMTGAVSGSTFGTMTLCNDNAVLQSASTTFVNPVVRADNSDGSWVLDSLAGPITNEVVLRGTIYGNGSEVSGTNVNSSAYDSRQSLNLYATKTDYKITLMDPNSITATAEGRPLVFADDTTYYEWADRDVQITTVAADSRVVIKPNNSAMLDKTVVWYFDETGLLHNVYPTYDYENGTMSFIMPRADITVWCRNEMTLYLDLYEIGFTPDGFRAEYEETRDDSTFHYTGDIRIRQSNIRKTRTNAYNITGESGDNSYAATTYATGNRMIFDAGAGNKDKRKITLDQIIQIVPQGNGIADRRSWGTWITKGEDVQFDINGTVRYSAIRVDDTTSLHVKGTGKETSTFSAWLTGLSSGSQYSIGSTAKAGDVTIEDVFMFMPTDNIVVGGTSKNANATITFRNVDFKQSSSTSTGTLSSRTSIASYCGNVVFDNCNLGSMIYASGYSSSLFPSYNNLTMHDTTLDFTFGSESTYGRCAFWTVSGIGQVTLSGSTAITETQRTGAANKESMITSRYPVSVTMTDDASWTRTHRLNLRDLTMSDNAKVTVTYGTGEHDGIIQAQSIHMNGGEINAPWIVISGYYESETESRFLSESNFISKAQTKTSFREGTDPGIIMNGGTINAEKFIGGDMGGKIRVNGGELNAPAIGSYGGLFGTPASMGATFDSNWFYIYETVPENGVEVIVDGGTVNVADDGYLGGMNGKVLVNSGTVNLGDGAILGLTPDQVTILTNDYSSKGDSMANHKDKNVVIDVTGGTVQASGENATGSIAAPYSEIDISGSTTSINVKNLSAENGTINIDGANAEAIDNTYTGDDRLHSKVAVNVTDTLSAESINITNGSVVFATEAVAYVDVGQQGGLVVQTEDAEHRAYLYTTEAYGAYGDGDITNEYREINTETPPNKNIFGIWLVNINYVLNPAGVLLDTDVELVENDNITFYNATTTSEKVQLSDAVCLGYNFKGWYEIINDEERPVEEIDKLNRNDLTLYARWERVNVPFIIYIAITDPTEVNDTMTQVPGTDMYYFNTPAYAEYGSNMLSPNAVYLPRYATNNSTVNEVAITDLRYNNGEAELISGSTTVTKPMVAAYLETGEPLALFDGSLVLTVTDNGLIMRNIAINFLLNKNEKGRPIDAQFNYTSDPQTVRDDYIQSFVPFDRYVLDGQGFSVDDGHGGRTLLNASASGYTFRGWFSEPEAVHEVTDATRARTLFDESRLTVYAVWDPNVYRVRFQIENGGDAHRWVTVNDTEPAIWSASNPDVAYLDYEWQYDTACGDGAFTQNGTHYNVLPTAWKEGYVFVGWSYLDGEGEKQMLTPGMELNKTTFENLDITWPQGEDPAITFTAEFRKAKVSYDLNGGAWSDAEPTQYPDYGTALPGYTQTGTAPTGGRFLNTANASYTDEYNRPYRIIDTSVVYFENNNEYVQNDFREDLIRKGYSFYGWTDAENNYHGAMPRFEDLDLTAQWHANNYSIVLLGMDTNAPAGSYEASFNSYAQTSDGFGMSNPLPVTVGEEINLPSWPLRDGSGNSWFAANTSNPNADSKRLLLGATFAPMDPGLGIDAAHPNGSDRYVAYAGAVTRLQNADYLFQNHDGSTPGTIFVLPENDAYSATVGDAAVTSGWSLEIPDYPEDSTIKMYGIYRERSLVFIEHYVDSEVHETILRSVPWNAYSTFPSTYDESEVVSKGFTFRNWYVNTKYLTSGHEYPSNAADYDAKKLAWRDEATALGTYDLLVYTVYLAQDIEDVVLEADANPVTTNDPVVVETYTVPYSMQPGYISLVKNALTESGVENVTLVPVSEITEHALDMNWDGHNSKAAIIMTVNGTDYDLSTFTGVDYLCETSPEDTITFTLYHSKLMSTDALKNACEVRVSFDTDDDPTTENPLESQFISLNVKVQYTPSEYEVTYTATMPEELTEINVSNWNSFTEGTTSVLVRENVPLNEIADQAAPTVDNYTPRAWQYVSGPTADGKLAYSTTYDPATFELVADEGTLDRWTVSYTDHLSSSADANSPLSTADTAEDVKFHSTVTIDPIAAGEYPEYVTVTVGSEAHRLDDGYAEEQPDGSYVFRMPAENVSLTWNDVKVLYLDDGSIELKENSYIQNGEEHTWHGHYVVLQNANDIADQPAEDTNPGKMNSLRIEGDLSGRTVELGNLLINSDDSIRLTTGTTVELTPQGGKDDYGLRLKNILVPDGSNLSMTSKEEGPNGKTNIRLSPNALNGTARAGIGGSADYPANGNISLDNLNISMNMVAPSTASGIGSGTQDPALICGSVSVSNCDVKVKETSSAGDRYRGAWIGGAGVSSVTVDASNVTIDPTSSKQLGSKVVDGKSATIRGTAIGTTTAPVPDPIYAENSLVIENSHIYMVNEFALGNSSMVGTSENGVTTVTDSDVQVSYTGSGSSNALYTGVMKITDAASDVTIKSTQILDVSNGDTTITASGVTQSDKTHTHANLNYLLLDEFNTTEKPEKQENDLTVQNMAPNTTITVKQPHTASGNTAVKLDEVSIQNNTTVVLKGNLTTDGEVSVASGKTLNVNANSGNTMDMEAGFSNDSPGNYTQTGGALVSSASDVVIGGNMTLNGVNANVGSHNLGSNGAAGVTTVTASNNTSVVASVFGANGPQDESFTYVNIDSTSSYSDEMVADWYRLKYVDLSPRLSAAALPKVYRTSTIEGVTKAIPVSGYKSEGVPNDPEELTGITQFCCWYIMGDETQPYHKLELTDNGTSEYLDGVTQLSIGTQSVEMLDTNPADGTRTLTIHTLRIDRLPEIIPTGINLTAVSGMALILSAMAVLAFIFIKKRREGSEA